MPCLVTRRVVCLGGLSLGNTSGGEPAVGPFETLPGPQVSRQHKIVGFNFRPYTAMPEKEKRKKKKKRKEREKEHIHSFVIPVGQLLIVSVTQLPY